MKCKNCGAYLSDNQKVCPECGVINQIHNEDDKNLSEQMGIDQVQISNNEDSADKNTEEIIIEMEEAESEKDGISNDFEKKKIAPKTFAICTVMILILIASLVGYFMFGRYYFMEKRADKLVNNKEYADAIKLYDELLLVKNNQELLNKRQNIKEKLEQKEFLEVVRTLESISPSYYLKLLEFADLDNEYKEEFEELLNKHMQNIMIGAKNVENQRGIQAAYLYISQYYFSHELNAKLNNTIDKIERRASMNKGKEVEINPSEMDLMQLAFKKYIVDFNNGLKDQDINRISESVKIDSELYNRTLEIINAGGEEGIGFIISFEIDSYNFRGEAKTGSVLVKEQMGNDSGYYNYYVKYDFETNEAGKVLYTRRTVIEKIN